ncbi:MAG TPA: hypothetical protein VHO25_01660, partial [Polyangiaceae bacterium]|nr:hypothetical protein [Polyangiaceae bacterium]
MALPALRAALGQFFDASKLDELCRETLDVDPALLGDTDDLASRIDTLLQHCSERHLLEALSDAVYALEPAARDGIASERAQLRGAQPSHPAPLAVDTEWGPFRIQEHLGRGATGDCYRALHGDNAVRLKVLRADPNSSATQRLLSHARLLNRLSTAGLPKQVHAGTVEGRPFIANAWQPGQTLQQRLQQDGPFAPAVAIALARDILGTLQQLHDVGLCAGSLVSSNVLLASDPGDTTATLLDISSNLALGKANTPDDDLIALVQVLYAMLSAAPTGVVTTSVIVPPSAAGVAQLVAPALDELVVSLLNGKLVATSATELLERLQNVSLSDTSDDGAIERLLELSEAAASKAEKAELFHKIGTIYERERNDGDQALVAYIQALCEDPLPARHAASVDRVAGQNPERWHDVLAAAGDAVSVLDPAERKVLLLQLGAWAMRLNQPDTALSAFSAALELEPTNEVAGEALEQIYRDRQQWSELRNLLLRRARDTQDVTRAAELCVTAAEIAELRLADSLTATEEYARILDRAPLNERAFRALSRHYEKGQDFTQLRELLRTRARASSGAAAAALHLQIAELSGVQLKDFSQARNHFELALQNDETNQEAWLGLERVLVEQKQTQPLLDLLNRRLSVAETPRERLDLLWRCAVLYEQDLLDPQRAVEALTQMLEIDPRHEHAKAALIANQLRAAEKHLTAGELDLAAEHFRLTLDRDSDQLAALQGLSGIELQQGNVPGVLVLLEKQASLGASRGSPTTVLDLLIPLLDLVPSNSAALLVASTLAF